MPGDLESRLLKLERLAGLGLGGDLATVQDTVTRLGEEMVGLRTNRNVGNVLGGMISTDIAPGLLPVGPYRQDVDTVLSMEFNLWISTEILRIRRMTLHLTPKASRQNTGLTTSSGTLTTVSGGSSTTPSGGGSTTASGGGSTTVSGGGSTTTSGGGSTSGSSSVSTTNPEGQASVAATTGTHNHRWAVFVSSPATLPAGATYQRYNTYDSAAGLPGTPQQFDISIISGTLGYTGAPLAGAGGSATTSVAPAAHTHGMAHDHTTPNHTHATPDHQHATPDHSHATPNHVHDTPAHQHDVPGHTHPITLSITESGMAAGMHLYIDGVDRTSLFSGPWSAASDIVLDPGDLLAVGLVDSRLTPVYGVHAIKVTSTAAGAVEVVGDYSVIIKGVQ